MAEKTNHEDKRAKEEKKDRKMVKSTNDKQEAAGTAE
jgi:hypothetical protein